MNTLPWRPVLAIGPEDGDAARILRETQTGFINAFGDEKGMMTTVGKLFEDFKRGKLVVNPEGYQQFSRKNMARLIISLPFLSEAGDIRP
jgi:hypothetical protein